MIEMLCRLDTVLPICWRVTLILANVPFIWQGLFQEWQNFFHNVNDRAVVRLFACAYLYTGERRTSMELVMPTWLLYKTRQYCGHLALLAVWKLCLPLAKVPKASLHLPSMGPCCHLWDRLTDVSCIYRVL